MQDTERGSRARTAKSPEKMIDIYIVYNEKNMTIYSSVKLR